jgi:hypothetical protein
VFIPPRENPGIPGAVYFDTDTGQLAISTG